MGAIISFFGHAPPRQALPPPHPQVKDIEGVPNELSKNARKRIAREKRLQERRQERKAQRRLLKAQEKITKRTEREQRMSHLPEEERQRLMTERIQIMRAGRAEERSRKAHLREMLVSNTKYHVCIDLGWNEHMHEKEQKSLARQLSYSYNALRKSVSEGMTPVKLSITGMDDVIKPVMTFVSKGWETWPLSLSDEPLEAFHDPKQLVYLTHDAEQVLDELNPNDVYVIGGIVDRNRLKNATMNKANLLGIRSARLNLDTNISLGHGTPVLTVNHCVEIMIYAANGMSWKDAYMKVLPVRKGISSAKEKVKE